MTTTTIRPRTQTPLVFKKLGRTMTFMGGPYVKRPINIFGIKLAPEIDRPADYTVNIEDFGVPTPEQLSDAVTVAIKEALINGKIYAGCMGGIGRTGTLMGAIARVFIPDGDDPVEYVRDHYLGRAIETEAQEKLVRYDFDPEPIRAQLNKWAILAWLRLLRL